MLRQEFSDRFSGFERLKPSVTLMTKPFIDVEISGQMAEVHFVNPVEMENNVRLKS